ncbi:hypothetical protein ACS0TY_034288 [Phlomoides rotata]
MPPPPHATAAENHMPQAENPTPGTVVPIPPSLPLIYVPMKDGDILVKVCCDCLINDCIASSNVSMKFRNYLPHDKQLQAGKLAPPVLPKFEDPVPAAPHQEEKKEDPFLNIAPKKPNWDLRRDVQKRLNKLERCTQKAMLTLMGWSFSFFGNSLSLFPPNQKELSEMTIAVV